MTDKTQPDKSAVPAVVEPELNGHVAALMKAGFIRRGEYEAARMQIQNHLEIRDTLASGEYKKVVESVSQLKPILKGLEPRDAYLQLVGISPVTFWRRDKELTALGAESVSMLKGIGVPYREIRMLADGPESLRKELRDRVGAGDISREIVDTMVGKLQELAEAKVKARLQADEAEKRAETAEQKLKRERDGHLTDLQELKTTKAELRDARSGYKVRDEKEAEQTLKMFEGRVMEAFELVGQWEPKECPRALAALCACLDKWDRVAATIRAQYLGEDWEAFGPQAPKGR